MEENPYESPRTEGDPPVGEKSPVARRLVQGLVLLGILAVLVALLLPAVRSGGREAARRSQCNRNLKNIAWALRSYAAEYEGLPPVFTVDADGNPLHSWRTLILPFIEQAALYNTIDLSKPWDAPVNQQASEVSLSVYRCPSVVGPDNHANYLAVVAPFGCFQPTSSRKLSDIPGDAHSVLLVIEVNEEHSLPWMAPTEAIEPWLRNLDTSWGQKVETSVRTPHPGGVQGAMLDGSVRFLTREELDELISKTSSGTSQLIHIEAAYSHAESHGSTVARPPRIRSTTAEHSSRNIRHIQRRWASSRRATAARQPHHAQVAVAMANNARPTPAMAPVAA